EADDHLGLPARQSQGGHIAELGEMRARFERKVKARAPSPDTESGPHLHVDRLFRQEREAVPPRCVGEGALAGAAGAGKEDGGPVTEDRSGVERLAVEGAEQEEREGLENGLDELEPPRDE